MRTQRFNGVRAMSDVTKTRNELPHVAVNSAGPDGASDASLDAIRDALRGLRYGTVSIVVQDGVIVQIERTEKRRLR
jgi:hypothetical protein